jgi:hypothetical protein
MLKWFDPLLYCSAERRAKFRRGIGGEAVAHDVFGDDARDEELKEVIAAAGFGSAAGHLEAAERMAPDNRAGAGTIDVNIARDQLEVAGPGSPVIGGNKAGFLANPAGRLRQTV